ncbi:hypothetical protein E8E13_009231 [Curvularia kusanoi]|uniref:Uncharacterized protein n=1 Tax=Curvularia kusanoi TaxID=90978 RepID=A0A9P4TIE2_CURKU|nr:hypothetical protein E8E13_009231 [Curvularia kusanoi]
MKDSPTVPFDRQVTIQTPRHDPPIPTFLPVDDNDPRYEPGPVIDYRGYYSVGPDIFQPVQSVVGGFATATPSSTITQIRRIDFDRGYLDCAGTPWGKWYAKHPTAETLPFAKACREDTEPTELQVWDAHVAKMAQYREAPSIPTPEQKEDYAVYQDILEDERAERLRYHTGHCFGAITGDVYPYQSGLIF